MLTLLPVISTFYLFTTLSATAFSQEHFRLSLPPGAKSRVGKGKISQLKYFPDGKRLAVATSIGVWVYDVNTGEALDLLIGHTSDLESMAFSPDGEMLATGSVHGTIRLWDAQTVKHKKTLIGHKDNVENVVFSPSGKLLASCNASGKVYIWDLSSGKVIHNIQSDASTIFAIAFSHDEQRLHTIGNWDRHEFYIEYWDVNSGESIEDVLLIDENFTAAALSPDGTVLACGGNSPLQYWDIETAKQLFIDTETKGQFDYLDFSADGSHLIAAEPWEYLSLWRTSPMQLLKNITHGERYKSIAYSPDGKTVASGNDKGLVKIWDTTTGNLIQTISGHQSSRIYAASYPHDNDIITIGVESEIQFWNVQTCELEKTIPDPRNGVFSVKYSPDKKLLASGGGSKKARLWDPQNGRFLGSFVGHKNEIYVVDFSPDASMLASAGGQKRRRPELKKGSNYDNSVCIWEIRSGELYLIGDRLAAFTEHTDWVNTVVFSPDGETLASGSQDKTIQLWDVKSFSHLRTITGHEDGVNAIAFSPDGMALASASHDKTIRIWNAHSGDLLLPPIQSAGHVTSLAYSPDGDLIASSTQYTTTVQVWNAKTGEKLRSYTGHTGRINAVVFSPDGKTLVSVSSDCTVLIWDLQSTITN